MQQTSFGQISWTQKRLIEPLVNNMIAYIVPMELLWRPTVDSAMTRFSSTGEFSGMFRFKKHWKVFAENVRFHQSPIQRFQHHSLTIHHQKDSLRQRCLKITDNNFSSKLRQLTIKSLTLSSLKRREKQNKHSRNSKTFVQITHQSGRQLFPEQEVDWFIASDPVFHCNFRNLPCKLHIKTVGSLLQKQFCFPY